MFNNLNSDLNKKANLPVNYRGMRLMDHPVWWDKETVVAYHMETSHTARIMLIISYLVKQYLKFDKLQILR
jgi:hypothetical protein